MPAGVPVCRCGTGRQVAEATAHLSGGTRPAPPLPWDVKALAVALVVLFVAAVASLFRPYDRPRIVPLLGYADTAPSPSPRPSPSTGLVRTRVATPQR